MGTLEITVKIIIFDEQGIIRVLPAVGSSTVAVVGIYGILGFKQGMNISNLMELGDGIRQMISEKTFAFKKFTDANSLDLFLAYQKRKPMVFMFEFAVDEGNFIQVANLVVVSPKIKKFVPHAQPVSGVSPPIFSGSNGFEKLELEVSSQNSSVRYGTKLDPIVISQLIRSAKQIGMGVEKVLGPIGKIFIP